MKSFGAHARQGARREVAHQVAVRIAHALKAFFCLNGATVCIRMIAKRQAPKSVLDLLRRGMLRHAQHGTMEFPVVLPHRA